MNQQGTVVAILVVVFAWALPALAQPTDLPSHGNSESSNDGRQLMRDGQKQVAAGVQEQDDRPGTGMAALEIAEAANRPTGITIIGFRQTWGNQAKANDDPMPAPLRDALERAGLGPITGVEWEEVTPTILQQSRVVIVLIWPHRLTLTKRDKAVVKLIHDYAAAGGGVLFAADRQQQYKDHIIPMAIADAFGTAFLVEQVHAKPEVTWRIGEWASDTFTFTDRIFPPLDEGVRGIFFQTESTWAYRGVVPFDARQPWKVVVDTGKNAWTTPLDPPGLELLERNYRDHGFDQNVPLLGIREIGKGRAACSGMNLTMLLVRVAVGEAGLQAYTTYMRDGRGSYPSNMIQLLVNLLTWLGEDADALASAQLTMEYDDAVAEFEKGWAMRRGIVGPRTTYSSGTATPDEYVDKARQLGLDFIVFLEEFAAMDRQDFDKLRDDCNRLTTKDFIAVPGITWVNEDGNHQYAYGNQLLMPSDALVDDQEHILGGDSSDGIGELCWLYELNSFENQAGWYLFKDNPYPFYDARDVASMGVVTQKGSQVVERVVDEWAYTNFHDQCLWPLALNLATSPDELDGIQTGDVYVNVIGTSGFEQLYDNLNTMRAARAPMHRYPKVAPFGGTSVTQGPVINLEMPRADTNTEEGLAYCRHLQNWPVDLTVESSVPLSEVRVYDGQRPVRRFDPNGKRTFQWQTSLTKEFQHHIWVHAVDVNGREGFSRSINCNAWLMREVQCTDRNNQLFSMMSQREDGTKMLYGYSGTTCTPDKGPWNPKIRPVGAFIFDPVLGLGAMNYDGSPEGEPIVWTAPEVWWNGKAPGGITKAGWLRNMVTGREGGPHNRPERVVASSEVLVGEMVLDGVFPLDPTKEFCHVWHTMQPVIDSKVLATTLRKTYYRPKIDGINVYLLEQTFETLTDIPVGEDKDWAIQFGRFAVPNGKRIKRTVRRIGDQPPYTGPEGGDFTMSAGDYVGFLEDPFGSLVVYNIGSPLLIQGRVGWYWVRIPAEGRVIPKGSKYTVRLVAVAMHCNVEDPVALAEEVKQQYGLGVEQVGYTVKLANGQVTDQTYLLSMNAGQQGNIQGVVNGLDRMAGNIGTRITGLNPGWSACLYRGGDEPDVLFIPVTADGIGRATFEEDLNGKPLFVGHPYVADVTDVKLALSRTNNWKQWQIEVHNPLGQAVTVSVRNAEGWPGPAYVRTFDLPAGSSQNVVIGDAIP